MNNFFKTLIDKIIFFGIILIILYTLYLFFFRIEIALKFGGLIYYLVLFVLIIFIIINSLFKYFNLNKLKKYSKNKNPNTIIIFGIETLASSFFYSIYNIRGLNILINYFNQNNIKFKICFNISRLEFDEILNNKNIKNIYLIGHGRKTAFKLNKNELILSYDYQNSKIEKDSIHLYHCTHENGKSLIDFLVSNKNKHKCYIKNGLFYSFFDKIKISK